MPAANPIQDVIIHPGMNELVDARMLPIGTPKLIQNIRVRQAARFEKRPGTNSLSTNGFPSAGSAGWVGEHHGTAWAGIESKPGSTRQRTVYSLGPDNVWSMVGRQGVVIPRRRIGLTARKDTTQIGYTSCAAVGGMLFAAYADRSTTTVHLAVIDPEGTIIRETTVSNADMPRVVYANSQLMLMTRLTTGAGKTIEVRNYSTATLALIGTSSLATTLVASTSLFDCANLESSTDWLIAYPDGATSIRVTRLTGANPPVLVNTAAITTVGIPDKVGIAGQSGQKVAVAYQDGANDIKVTMLSDALAGAATVTVDTLTATSWETQIGIVRTASNGYAVVACQLGTTASPAIQYREIRHTRVSTTPALTAGPYSVYNAQPASKPFTYGEEGSRQVLVWAVPDIGEFGAFASHYILELDSASPQLAGISYDEIADYTLTNVHLPEVADFGNGMRATLLRWGDFQVTSVNKLAGVDVAIFDMPRPTESLRYGSRQVISLNNAMHVSGAALSDIADPAFLGSHYVSENGFMAAPIIDTALAAGGSLTSGKVYTYAVTYLRADGYGRVHQSSPGNLVTSSPSGANLSTVVRATALPASGRDGLSGGVNIDGMVWRSWDGGPHYLVGLISDLGPGAVSATFTDTVSDATAQSNPVLYTDLGILPTFPPSGARLICDGGQRMFAVGWRENVVQFSKLIIPTAPVEFCDDNSFRVDCPEGITAIHWLDGTLIIFSAHSIYLVTGDGPNDQGVGAFSEPRRLPVSVGCDEPRSLVETSAGLWFKGGGTLWLLPRGFGPPQPIGDALQNTLGTYPYVISAALCANTSDDCVHFVLGDADTISLTTKVAIWDNRMNAWSLDDILGEIGAAGSVGGKFTWLLPDWDSSGDLPVRQFSVSQYQDRDASGVSGWIESRIDFGDARPFGPLGWGTVPRAVVLGETQAACKVKFSVSVNGGTPVVVSNTPASPPSQFYIEYGLSEIKGCSFRFSLYDAEDSGKTAGAVFNAMAFEGHAAEGTKRLAPATERFT